MSQNGPFRSFSTFPREDAAADEATAEGAAAAVISAPEAAGKMAGGAPEAAAANAAVAATHSGTIDGGGKANPATCRIPPEAETE